MAVAESATSQSKAAGQTTATSGARFEQKPLIAGIRLLTFSLWLALGMVTLPIHAEIIVNINAPSNERATVLNAANGVPQVNIQTASEAGVSRNSFTTFDVDKQGAILNNSRTDVQTQLGGWIQANPWLAKGEARIILNEVNSSNPSQLLGYIEVAGRRAEVIIANASGITCDGCGFINASQATLTTGVPQFLDGNLNAYAVQKGIVRIDGAGLDASTTDYTAIMARAVQINAGVWANKLKITTGANQVDAAASDTASLSGTSLSGTSATPAFAIDVSQLGGMYAGVITLVGTDAGVGIRNTGSIGASAGSVVVTADGMIENSGQVSATANVHVDTTHDIQNSGTVYAQGNAQLASNGTINNQGVIAAQNNTALVASGTSSQIISSQDSVLGAGVHADGTLGTSGNLSLTATKNISTQGQTLSGGDQTLTAQSLNLSGSSNSADNLTLNASIGDITLTGATLATTYTLTANTTQTLRTDQATVSANQLTLTARDLSNVKGELVQVGTGDLTVNLVGTLNNIQGRIASNSEQLTLKAANINNSAGSIEHAGTGELNITTQSLKDAAGLISSNGLLAIKATSTVVDNGSLSAAQLKIDSQQLSNRGGVITQRGTAATEIISTTQFDNTSGSLISQGATTLNTGTLTNLGGKIQVGDSNHTADLQITASGAIDNGLQQGMSGIITATGNTTVNANSLNNTQGHISATQAFSVTTTQAVTNQQGILAGNDAVTISATQINNNQGTIGSVHQQTQVTATTGKLDNTAGRIEAARAVTVSATGINNTDGTITGSNLTANSQLQTLDNTRGTLATTGIDDGGALDLQTGALINDAGLIQSQGTLTADTHGQILRNTQTSMGQQGIISAGTIDLATGELDNSDGYLGSAGKFTTHNSAINNMGGNIASSDALDLNGTTLNNQGGQIQVLGDTDFNVTGQLDNTGSLIRVGNTLTITAATLTNANTTSTNQGIEAQAVNLNATHINNVQGAVRADENLTVISHGTIDNRQGLLSAGATATLTDTDLANRTLQITNTAGTLIAGESLNVNSAGLTSDGKLLSQGDLAITLAQDYTHTGELQANGSASLETTGTLTNQSRLLGGTALTLKAATLDNQAGAEISAANLSLTATDSHTLTNRGLINGGVETFIDTITLNNIGTGRIYGGHLAINATTITNDVENGVAAVMAARNRLDLGAQTITNREHALILSLGDMAIGGSLDSNHRATGQAAVLNNTSATIEALGSLNIAAQQLNNINAHLVTQAVTTNEDLVDYEGITNNQGVGIIYRAGTPDVYVFNDQSDHLHTPEGDYEQWQAYRFNRTVSETLLISSDPAHVTSGAGMHFAVQTLVNDNSAVIAGGAITGTVGDLQNNNTEAPRVTTDVGTLTDYWRDFEKGRDKTGSKERDYLPPQTIETITLIPVAYQQHTAPANTGTQITSLTTGTVTAAPASTTAAVVIHNAPAISPITQIAALTSLNNNGTATVVRTGGVNTRLPNNSLFQLNPSPTANYLIETDPAFTNNRLWLNSDYLLAALAIDPALTQKRLGDGFYEQQLIREQIALLTGRRFLEGYADDEAQYQALMNNATTYVQDYTLRPGIALTAEQMAALTSDIVWLVETTVTLANGSTTKVLVPQVYVRVREGDINGAGTLISGNSVDLNLSGDLTNSGTMAGRTALKLNAENIENLGGRLSAETVALNTRKNLVNLGGKIDAVSSMNLEAQHDIIIASVTSTGTSVQGTRTTIDRVAGLYVTGTNGTLLATAGHDMTISAAQVINRAPTTTTESMTADTGGITRLSAGNNLNINSLTESATQTIADNTAKNELTKSGIRGGAVKPDTHTSSHHTEVASLIDTSGDLKLQAGNDLGIKASRLNADGNVSLDAVHDVNLTAAANERHRETTTGNHKGVDTSITHTLVDMASGSAISIHAGNDANLTGTAITSAGDTAISALRDTNISSVVDSEYHYSKDTDNKSFGRRTTTTTETLNETVVGGTIDSGGDVFINAHKNTEGEVITEQSGNVNLAGVTVAAKNDLAIAADENVNITGTHYETLDYQDTKKTGSLGFSKKEQGIVASDKHLQNASISAGGNAHVLAGNDVTLAATNVVAKGNVDMQAVDNLLITAGEAISNSEEWSKKSGLFSNESLYSKSEHKDGEGVTSAQASNIHAGGQVTTHSGTGQVIGSNVSGDTGVKLVTDAGDLDVLAARNTTQAYNHDKTMTVGVGDLAKAATRPDQLVQNKDGRATVKIADAQFDSVDGKSTATAMQASNIESREDVTLIAGAGNLNVKGSNVAADTDNNQSGNLGLAAATGVNVLEATDTYESETKETHGSAELSVVVQHQAVEVVKAVIAVDKAKEQLEKAKKEYKAYERNLDDLKSQLTQLEDDYKNKTPGVQYDDVLELRDILKDAKGDKEWYQAGVALAAVNLASSITGLVQQIAAAVQSTGTYGFNAGVQLDIDATKSKATDTTTTAVASNLSGNNILIQTGTANDDGSLNKTGTETNIQGSHLAASNNITVQTGELNITNSKDTSEHKNETEHGHITAQVTVYGASGGANVSGSFDRSKSSDTNSTINNSTLGADSINLETTGDTNIRGGNVHADSALVVDAGGDLNVESQQNRSRSKNTSMGVSGGVGLGADGNAASVNAGVSGGNGMSMTKTTVLTSLTSSGTADINVEGNTQITSALIATVDAEGKDTGQLNLNTQTLHFTELRDTSLGNQTSAGVSTNMAVGDTKPDPTRPTIAKGPNGKELNVQTTNLTYANSQTNAASKTLATLGHGNITVGGTRLEENGVLTEAGKTAESLIALNRDTENTTKELWNSEQSQTVDVTLDHRMLTTDGRKAIAEDFKRTEIAGQSVIELTDKSVSLVGNGEGETSLIQHMSDNQNYFTATKEFANNPDNKKYVETLANGGATPAEKNEAYTVLANSIATQMGVSPIEAMTLVQDHNNLNTRTYEGTDVNQRIEGAFASSPDGKQSSVFIVDDNIKNTSQAVDVLGHEVSHGVDASRNVAGINTKTYETNRESYADLMGAATVDYTNYNFASNDYTALGAANLHTDANKNNATVQANNAKFNSLDPSTVDYRQLYANEMQAIRNAAPGMVAKEGGTEKEAEKRMTAELVSYVDASWKASQVAAGKQPDTVASRYLAEALLAVGEQYAPASNSDVPVVGDKPTNTYTADDVQGFLTNYSQNHSQEYNDRTLGGDDLSSPLSAQSQFYTKNFSEIPTLKDGLNITDGTLSGYMDALGDVAKGFQTAVLHPIDTAEASSLSVQGLMYDPLGAVNGAWRSYEQTQINTALDSYQGDHFNAARSDARIDAEVVLALGGVMFPATRVGELTTVTNIGKSAAMTGDAYNAVLASDRLVPNELQRTTNGSYWAESDFGVLVETYEPSPLKIPGLESGHSFARSVTDGGTGRSVAGHGSYWSQDGVVIVPEGASVTLPRPDIAIMDKTGRFIENGDWSGLARAATTNERIANDIEGMATWLPGSEVPNYTLTKPSGLNIYSRSTSTKLPETLDDLLSSNMGCVNWAACTVYIDSAPTTLITPIKSEVKAGLKSDVLQNESKVRAVDEVENLAPKSSLLEGEQLSGANTPSAFSAIVIDGGLVAQETAGGHLLLKHVGQTEAQLLNRLAAEPKITGSSSFYDRATAEAAISHALDVNMADINAWLSTSKPQMVLEHTLSDNTGIIVHRGMSDAIDTPSLRLILRKDPNMPSGFRIHTGFPIQ